MTEVNVTPTGDSNQPKETAEPIDNMGNPVNPDGTPREVTTDNNDSEGGETVESLQKALKDTKAELTRLQQGKPKDEGEEAQSDDTEKNLQIQEKKAEAAGLDMSKYSEEYNADGGLSEDSYKELMDKGFDKQIVDDYIAGQEARVKQQTADVAKVVGGEENLPAVLEWAAENLSEAEINAYNKMTLEGTVQAKMGLESVYSKYLAANGKAPNLMSGDTTSARGDVFKSQFEMVKAMEDPRYNKDPDYQKEVAAKAARSHKAGTI